MRLDKLFKIELEFKETKYSRVYKSKFGFTVVPKDQEEIKNQNWERRKKKLLKKKRKLT